MKNLSGQVGVYRRPDTNNSLLALSIHPPIPVGEQFGKWVVLENDWYRGSPKYTDRACLVRCQCATESVVTYRALRNEISSSCLKCRPIPKRSVDTVWKCLFNIYKQRGRVMDRKMHLTLPQVKFVSQMPCAYCGKEPSNLFRRKYKADDGKHGYGPEMEIRYSGIDRVDATKGYIHGNVVPCCWECNKIKSALTLDEFLGLIERIRQHNPTADGIRSMAAAMFDQETVETASM